MGQEPDVVAVDTISQDEPEDVAEARARIEATRGSMSDTIDAIQDKLSPSTLMDQAKDAAMDKVQQVKDSTVGMAQQAVSSTTDAAKSAPSTVMDTVRDNPLPAALIGIGVGWLLMRSQQKQSSAPRYDTRRSYDGGMYSRYDTTYGAPYGMETQPYHVNSDSGSGVGDKIDQAQEKAGQMMNQAQESAGRMADQAQTQINQMADQAQTQTKRAVNRLQQRFQEQPLALGVLGLAVGLAVGLALPETQQENELMGEARDSLATKAQAAAQDTLQKAKSVAQEAVSTAKDEARSQGLAPTTPSPSTSSTTS